MSNVRRVNVRDIQMAGGLTGLISKLMDNVRTGNMEVKERAAMFLRSLTEQAKGLGGPQDAENAELIARVGGIKALVTLTVIGSPVAQKHACAALANIANHHVSNQEAILDAGGVLPIATALRAGDSGLQEQAAKAVSCVSQLEASRRAFIKVSAIPSLVKLLKDASTDTQVHASMALANLADRNPEGQSTIARTGALQLLIDQLGSGKSQEAVANAVAKLCFDHEDNQAEVARLDGIPKLVALLNVVSAEAQARAAQAIAALASGNQRHEKDMISKAGGIRPLLALIESRYTHTQRSAINAVAMIAMGNRENQDDIAAMGGILPLVSITQAGAAYPPDVQAQTVLALAQIARDNFENQTSIAQIGALPSLVNLIRHSNSSLVEAEVAGAMWSLSDNHPNNKVAMKQAGAIPVLMPQIGSQSERAQENAANAIASLTFENEDNQAEATALLVGLLEDPNTGTVGRAAELLWRMVDDNPNSKVVIAKSGGASPLVRLLHSKQMRAKAYALWSLSLSIDEASQKTVADAGGIKPLVYMLNASNKQVNEQAACAIQRLSHANRDTQQAIADQGAIEPLIALLDKDDDGEPDRSQEYAAAALSDLALIQANKVAIDRGGGIQPLVALLSDTHQQLRSKKHAAAALARLSTDEAERQAREDMERQLQEVLERRRKKSGDQQQYEQQMLENTFRRKRLVTKAETIASAGAIGPLVELLNGNLGPEAQEEGAHALWALADVSANRKSITEHGGIGPLVELLGCENSKAREHAEGALVRLSIEDVNRVLIIKQLVGMLQENSGTAAQEQAAAALANLARESTDNRSSILEAGGIPRLIALLHSTSTKAKENSVSAVAQLAFQNPDNQNAIAAANGIPSLVTTLIDASLNSKELALQQICTLTASAIWNLADSNPTNQTILMKEGAVPPIVALLSNLTPEMQTNAAGALAALARDHPDNQGAVARAGAIAPLCTMVRDGAPETREESAAALWACASGNAPNKATIAKLGGIEPLVSMLMYATTDTSSLNAAGALAALAKQHSDNCSTITKRMVGAISSKAPPPRAVRLLNAVATLCDNESMNQIALSKMGGIQPLIPWLENPSEDVQVQGARAMLAVVSNNATTQSLVGNLGAIKPLVFLVAHSVLPAQENAACALWHLATLGENRVRIAQAKGLAPLVGMLVAESDRAPQIAAMTLLRLAEGSTKAANTIADVKGIKPLVSLLETGTMATQQMSAACLAAIGAVSRNRNPICDSGGIRPLIKLLVSKMLGSPETAARALGCLARDDSDDAEIAETREIASEREEHLACGDETASTEVKPSAALAFNAGAAINNAVSGTEAGIVDVAGAEAAAVTVERIPDKKGEIQVVDDEEEGTDASTSLMYGGSARRTAIQSAGGIVSLISMLDGSNLCGKDNVLKPPVVGGWSALRIGIEGCLDGPAFFPGSQADFGVRIGMQEQAASTLSDLAFGDPEIQDVIIKEDGVAPLLSLVRSGSQEAQEFSARALWYLSSSIDNQRVVVQNGAIVDLVQLLKSASPIAQFAMPAAACLAELAHGAILEREIAEAANTSGKRHTLTDVKAIAAVKEEDIGSMSAGKNKLDHTIAQAAPDPASSAAPSAAPTVESAVDGESLKPRKGAKNRLLAINEAGGIMPLVKVCEGGTPQGREKAAAAMWHLALDRENQSALAANGAIKPLVALLADGNPDAKRFASKALTRLATDNSDNQAQIAKRLVGLLDHDDSAVVSLAAFDLQALAAHPGAPIVIVNAGAISPLVSVLSNGKTDVGRNQAAKTLHTLANSGPANQLAIAIGLVALLGVGSDQAQEYVTQLLLTLTSGGAAADHESVKTNRRAIANAGPFRMLVMQLRSVSVKVRMLASAVLSKLSGDSEQNVTEIATSQGISPLVALLGEVDNEETQQNASAVLADMSRISMVHAACVASESGIPLLVTLVSSSTSVDTKANAADSLGSIAMEHARDVGSSGAILPLVKLIETDSKHAQKTAARALAAIAAGGKDNQDGVKEAGGVELLVGLLRRKHLEGASDESRALEEEVQSRAAAALAELARGNSSNQMAITACGGIEPLIRLVTDSSEDQPKVDAASTLWSLSEKNFPNQRAIANASGIEALVNMVGHCTLELGQEKSSGAIASLALDNNENLESIAEKLVEQLTASSKVNDTREKAARAISRFARSDPANQDALAMADCITLIVSQLEPRAHQDLRTSTVSSAGILVSKQESIVTAIESVDSGGKHHLTQKELASALWAIAHKNGLNQKSIAQEGGIPLLIAMLSDHPEVRRDAAGALWSLGADTDNQRLIAQAGGIPKLADLLKTAKNNTAQDTAAGALESLAQLPVNREQIADSDGISLLIPLFEIPCSDQAKRSVSGALLTLAIDNSSNQFNIANKLVAMLANGPIGTQDISSQAAAADNEILALLESQEHATRVLYTMTLERDYKDAIARTQAITQLVRQLKGGTEVTQHMASQALTQIARMSPELRIQVTQQLVTLLGDPDADVRQRAGTALRENSSSDANGTEDAKLQKEAVMAGGVAPLVELLRAGLTDDRVEAQEYSLWSLTMTTDPTRRRHMVEEGAISALIQSLRDGKLREESKEHASMVIACLAIDASNHDELVNQEGILQLVKLVKEETTTLGGKKQAGLALARITYHSRATQSLIADAGAIEPLVRWLGDGSIGPVDVGALCLAELARDNIELQVRIAESHAIPLIVAILVVDAHVHMDAHRAACRAVANLSRNMPSNQEAVAQAGGIPPLVKLLKVGGCQEEASNAMACLADFADNKMQIFLAGGIVPLVALLEAPNPNIDPVKTALTQQHTARAIESLARDCVEIQDALAVERASNPLVDLLASDSVETQESAVGALLCLAAHPENRTVVVVRLVGVLVQRNTAAQLKAAEALAVLAARSSINRTAIVHAGAIEPLVQLLGNGMRSEKETPPERAAAVLADLARFSESKVEIGRCGGIEPLVMMMSSSCEDARMHAACALRHLSATMDNKARICQLGGIEQFVELLSDVNADTQRHAGFALWQLATTAESKATIVDSGGIKPLVELMLDISPTPLRTAPWADTHADEAHGLRLSTEAAAVTVVRSNAELAVPIVRSSEAKEAAVAMLSELARNQGDNRSEIVKYGGITPLVNLLCTGTPSAQKYATCALWGISQEIKHRKHIAEAPGAIAQLVDLLRQLEGETQGFAASTLVCLAQEKMGKDTIMSVGGAGPLMTIALGPTSWLRSRCAEVLRLLGYPDPLLRREGSAMQRVAPISPRLAKFQHTLLKNPAIWMVPDEATKVLVNDEHMADLACKIKEGDRVLVDPGNRKAEVRFVGKIPEIGKGYWVGVQYDDPVGRNDGSVKGRRCFECTHDFGGFLRPNHIRTDVNPPVKKMRAVDADNRDDKPAESTKARKQRKSKAAQASILPVKEATHPMVDAVTFAVPGTFDVSSERLENKRMKQGQVVLATKVTRPTEVKLTRASSAENMIKDSPQSKERRSVRKK